MEYRVEELAAAAGVAVDTIRFYQTRGLLPRPKRAGRVALYGDTHLSRIRRIRRLRSQGFTLAVIKRLDETRSPSKARALLHEISDQSGERPFTREQFVSMSGVPEALLASVEAAGLLGPVEIDGEPRYGEAELEIARAGMELLRHEFPLDDLLRIAIAHARGVEKTVDSAIDLFDRHVRKADAEPDAVVAAFRSLLPTATTVVALHFQRTLLARALARLREHGDSQAIEAAQREMESGRLEVKWR